MGKSHQRGWVVLRGKNWYGYYRRTVLDPIRNEQKVDTVPVILGSKSQLTKFQARERLEQEIAKQNGQTPGGRVMNDGAVTFGWFVRNRFLPLKEANWKPETAKVKKLLIQKDLIDTFDHMPIESFDRFILQVHLNKLAKTRSKDRVLQMRAYVRDIFAEAVEQDFLAKDPARKVTVPSQLRDTDKTTLTWEQLRNALSHLALRDRILLELDMANALRPGELFALRWKCFDRAESKMYVFETAYKGAIRPWGKTKKFGTCAPAEGTSGRPVALEAGMSRRLARCIHLSGCQRRLYGHRQLPPARAAQAGEETRTAKADLPSDPAHHSDAGAEEGDGEGRSGATSSFTCGHNDRRVHAGDSGECAGDRQRDQR